MSLLATAHASYLWQMPAPHIPLISLNFVMTGVQPSEGVCVRGGGGGAVGVRLSALPLGRLHQTVHCRPGQLPRQGAPLCLLCLTHCLSWVSPVESPLGSVIVRALPYVGAWFMPKLSSARSLIALGISSILKLVSTDPFQVRRTHLWLLQQLAVMLQKRSGLHLGQTAFRILICVVLTCDSPPSEPQRK